MVVQPRLWSRAVRRQLVRGVGNSFSKIQKPPRPLWLGWGAVGLGFLERDGGRLAIARFLSLIEVPA